MARLSDGVIHAERTASSGPRSVRIGPLDGSEGPFVGGRPRADDGRMERPESTTAVAPRLGGRTPGRRELVRRPDRISIRPIEVTDASGLSDFYAALSERSRRQRFLGATREVRPDIIEELARAPGLVAVLTEAGPRDGAIMAHASIHPDGRGAAEAAFAVADDLQGHGLGSRLMAASVELARGLGIHRLDAILYPDNARMRRLLTHSGRPLVSDEFDAGTEEISLDLDRAA